jgi:uncharacterized membrane protein HdeD (DUF308 family)
MAKLTAWLVTLLGIILILAAMGIFSINDVWFLWVLGLAVLIIGIGKLIRNYSKRKR